MALDGNATLALEIHVVKHLGLHVLAGNSVSVLEQSVGECALAVVNVCHDAEVAYCFHSIDR